MFISGSINHNAPEGRKTKTGPKGRSLRFRIISSFFIPLLLMIFLTIIALEFYWAPQLRSTVLEDLSNSTKTLANSVKATASVAIRNHLKSIAEKNLAIAHQYHEMAEQGIITPAQEESMLRKTLLEQTVGTSGYLYCISSKGLAVVHPNPGVQGTDVTEYEFIRRQMEEKQGYLEYQWKNPNEKKARSKALYMTYFEPLDWIISVSSYRSEFTSLLKPEDFRDTVLALRFGETGYAYLINKNGELFIHPVLDPDEYDLGANPATEILEKISTMGSGYLEYYWQNPNESSTRHKLAVFESIPEFDWIMVSSAYLREVMRPVYLVRYIGYSSMIALVFLMLLVSYLLSGRITRPVDNMVKRLDNANKEANRVHMPEDSGIPELDRLSFEFNSFVKTIKNQNEALEEERARYLGLFEASPDAVFLLKGAKIVDCNTATKELFGGDADSINGLSVLDISPLHQNNGLKSKELLAEQMEDVQRSQLNTFEWVHQTLDGRRFDAEVRLKLFGHADGEILLVAFVRDISDRKRADQLLAESEKRYRQVFEESPVALFIQDFSLAKKRMDQLVGSGVKDLRKHLEEHPEEVLNLMSLVKITFANQATIALYEAEDRDTLLDSMRDFAPSKPSSHHVDQFVELYSGKRRHQGTGQNRTLKGKNLEVQVNKVVFPGFEHDLSRVLTTVLDLTGVRQAQRDKAKLEAQLRQAQKMEAIGTMAGGIAHDFNNILGGIMGYCELAQLKADEGEDNLEYLARIVQSAERARDLVKQILTFSRKSEALLKPVDLNLLLLQAKEILRHTLPKMIDIRMNLSPVLEPIRGDAAQLEQVVMNLAGNASDAMPEGGILSFETQLLTLDRQYTDQHLGMRPGRYLLLTVSDTGVGMNTEVVSKIFDPFFTTKEVGKGTGLGMSTVYGIVRGHNGNIYCYSEPQMGTTFKIFLPVQDQPPHPEQAPEPGNDIEPGRGERILLVDDEAALLEVNSAILKGAGYRVITANSGEEALEVYSNKDKPDMVILDLGMPGMGGHKALKALLAMDREAKVLIASGYAASLNETKLMADGASGFVSKPFRRLELLKRVRKILDN